MLNVFKPSSRMAAPLAALALLFATPGPGARAAGADDAAMMWEWVARNIATVARCADYDYERRDQYLDLLDQYIADVTDVRGRIENVLVQSAIRDGSRNPARDTVTAMDGALKKGRALVDEQNLGHDIHFVKNVCRRLGENYSAKAATFQPLADKFPREAQLLR